MTATKILGSNSSVELKRELGLFTTINLIIGIMIGSGIFITPSNALRYTGSVGMCLTVWCICGLISLMGALAYVELSTIIPQSGSDYIYYKKSFGPLHKFWGNIPSYAYSLMMIFLIKPSSGAVIILTFSKYFCQPILNAFCINDAANTNYVTKGVALLALGLITFINATSVKLYVKVQNIFGFFKIMACLIVIAGGIYEMVIGNTDRLSGGFEGTTNSPKDIALSFYSGLWAYSGWAVVTSVTEEIKRPEVNIPRGLVIALPIVTVLYVFMNVAYMTVLTKEEMINAPAVAVAFGDRMLGSFSVVIPIGVAFSTFGCALGGQFGVTRICYVSGKDGFMLESLAYVHHKKLTPCAAVVLSGLVTLIFLLIGDISELISFVSFISFLFIGISMVSLLVLRKTMKDVPRPYKVPIPIPVLMILIALYLTIIPIALDPSPKYLIAVGFVLLAIVLYYVLIYKDKRPKAFMKKLTYYVQLLFEVVPTEETKDLKSIENK